VSREKFGKRGRHGEEQQQSRVTGLYMGVGHITPAQSVAT